MFEKIKHNITLTRLIYFIIALICFISFFGMFNSEYSCWDNNVFFHVHSIITGANGANLSMPITYGGIQGDFTASLGDVSTHALTLQVIAYILILIVCVACIVAIVASFFVKNKKVFIIGCYIAAGVLFASAICLFLTSVCAKTVVEDALKDYTTTFNNARVCGSFVKDGIFALICAVSLVTIQFVPEDISFLDRISIKIDRTPRATIKINESEIENNEDTGIIDAKIVDNIENNQE